MVIGPRRVSTYCAAKPARCSQALEALVHGLHARHLVGAADLQVVLQVLADARELVRHLDAERLQHRARPDARELQDLRRADGAGRQDHLARRLERAPLPVLAHDQPRHALAVEHQPLDHGVRLDRQIAPVQHGAQEALGGVPADARLLVDVEVAAALVVAAIEILDLGDAGFRRRVAEGVQDLPADARLLDAPLAAARVQVLEGVLRERPLVLVLLEVGQHVVPAPAGIAHLPPGVVVARLAAHVDHAVDRRAAAQHLAARIGEAAAVEARLLRGLEAPVGARVAHQVEVADGDVDPVVVVLAAGLQQQHAPRRVRRQPIGQQTPRRPCADDDVVVGVCCHVGCVLCAHPNAGVGQGKPLAGVAVTQNSDLCDTAADVVDAA